MNYNRATASAISKAAEIIRNGGVVAFPTETVYGLGADAFNKNAVAKIFEIKNRPTFDPLIVHISDMSFVKKLCKKIDEKAERLMKTFWPGPLTLVLPKLDIVPDIVTSGLPTVGIRMPHHPIALKLIEESNTAIAAPSANPFGYLSPTTAEHVHNQIGEKVDMILDSGKCEVGVESTIIKIDSSNCYLLRAGGISLEDIENIVGTVEIVENNSKRVESPGQLKQHYSPRTPLIIVDDMNFEVDKNLKAGLLALSNPKNTKRFEIVEVLSERGDLREAAGNLFVCLHNLDSAHLDVIYAQRIPEVGLGRAIMERLYKAAHLK